MPLVEKIECSICGWSELCSGHVWVALDSDGDEVILGHPLETTQLAKVAGVSEEEATKLWSVWKAEGRLYDKKPGICRACGTPEYYRTLSDAQCVRCDSPSVHPLQFEGGCLVPSLLLGGAGVSTIAAEWIAALAFGGAMVSAVALDFHRGRRWKRRVAAIPCPECKRAGLSIDTHGIS